MLTTLDLDVCEIHVHQNEPGGSIAGRSAASGVHGRHARPGQYGEAHCLSRGKLASIACLSSAAPQTSVSVSLQLLSSSFDEYVDL